ncbi:hypothetical protein Aduo_005256 [Ancylostoma duodenale]
MGLALPFGEEKEGQPRDPATVKEAYDSWHKCFNGILSPILDNPEKVWSSFRGAVDHCYDTTPMRNIKMTGVSNKDEFKFHIFNNTDKTPSNVITLGIGWDVLAEQKLKSLLPNGSHFYGADPIYDDNDRLFSTVGQFFPLAVGNETMLSSAYVMPKQLRGQYVYRTMVHIDVITFLTKLTRTPFIDQFLMDNEGAEYDLLPMMGRDGAFDHNGITVCQINVEMHYGHANFKERFATIVKRLLEDRRYAVFRQRQFTEYLNLATSHQRTFLLNFENKTCVEKYISQYFK